VYDVFKDSLALFDRGVFADPQPAPRR